MLGFLLKELIDTKNISRWILESHFGKLYVRLGHHLLGAQNNAFGTLQDICKSRRRRQKNKTPYKY